MDALALGLMRSADIGRALAARDRAALVEAAGPVFRQMRAEQGIERMFFVAPDRQVLARVHDPRRNGDASPHAVVAESAATGIAAVGIERLSSGTVALAVSYPWVSDGRVIGILVLAVPVSRIANRLHAAAGFDLAAIDVSTGSAGSAQRTLVHASHGNLAGIVDEMLAAAATPPAAGLQTVASGLPRRSWSCADGRCRQAVALPLDEVRAGFRLSRDCSWSRLGVEPDLSTWGKGLANGHALSALLGSDSARKGAEAIYATGSFWYQAAPMAASLEVLRRIRETDYLERLEALGKRLASGL